MTEADGNTHELWPNDARLRNLTYACPMFIETTAKVSVAREHPVSAYDAVDDEEEAENGADKTVRSGPLHWQIEKELPSEKPHLGKMPIMLKSMICQLRNKSDDELFAHDECPYDQGGYFVINGSEKVLIAQERSAANIVQVFKKKQSNTPFVAEIRSALEKGSRLISGMSVKLYERGESSKGGFGQTIKVSLPYIKQDIPLAIFFRIHEFLI